MGVGIQIDSAGHEVPVSHRDVSLQGLPLRAIGSAPQKDNLQRTVNILRSNPGAVGNTITTALYTWYTFPTVGVLELIYPWNKFANFYFFLVGLMQMSPASLTNRQPSSWLTLTFICLCELYFKAKEDLARHRADAASNNEVVEVLAAIEESTDLGARDAFEPKAWKHVRVGDVVRVRARESFPADLLLLRGSDPSAPGQCWVNTKPLDGETDTKLRLAPKLLATLLKDEPSCEPAKLRQLLRGTVRCEEPNDKVNDITAQLCLDGEAPVLLSQDNFLLRGCQLRNTDYVLGLVIAAGVHTKINFTPASLLAGQPQTVGQKLVSCLKSVLGLSDGPKAKMGTIAKMVNVDIMGVVAWLVFMCTFGGATYVILEKTNGNTNGVLWYLVDDESAASGFFLQVARFFLICYQFVPISLYVSMMFYQTFCRYFLVNDLEAYDAAGDEPCQVRQMSLIDELGQVSHIFSDKTGTLTSNHMEFRRSYVFTPKGNAYGVGETAISKSIAAMRAAAAPIPIAHSPPPSPPEVGSLAPEPISPRLDLVPTFDGLQPTPATPTPSRPLLTPVAAPKIWRGPFPAFVGCKEHTSTYCNFEEAEGQPSLLQALDQDGPPGWLSRELAVNLAVNHSVLLEYVHGKLELSASSPDEQAFVAAAEYFGFEYTARDSDKGLLTILEKRTGISHQVEVLEVFPYESSRKRMSVIVRLPEALVASLGGGASVRLYTKGADSVLLADGDGSLLAQGSQGSDPESRAALDALLYEWADIALRTLVFVKRELPDFEAWHVQYQAANQDPEQVRKLKLGQPNAISDLQASLEKEYTLQGATALEDKLQDGVPEILADLRAAGIKIWMLTGDKVGTAKNIATACNILPAGCNLLEITTETFPVLNDVKTSELLAASKVLERAQAGDISSTFATGRNSQGSQNFTPNDRGSRMAGRKNFVQEVCFWWGKLLEPEKKDEQRNQFLLALEHQTELLDSRYPDLQLVRAALHERHTLMKSGGGGGGPGAAGDKPELCLVLDEKAIEYCGLLCKEVLAAVGHGSRSVVACRARKDQKAQMLNMIRESVPSSCCLAIGDGANDVAMIKAGHVGVGIIGKEGRQAVNNSDFAIGQFRFLRSLLLVHGRFVYRRTSLFCYYMFYKNITNVLAMYAYTMVALASGERIFVQPYIELYNIVLTSFPIILFCVFDQDLSKEKSARSPDRYTPGVLRIYYTHTGFVLWMLEAIWTAMLCIFVPALAFGYPGLSLASPLNGDVGLATISMAAMVLVCINVNLRLAIEMHSWHFLEHLFMWGSIIAIEILAFVFSFVSYPKKAPTSLSWDDLKGTIQNTWNTPAYYLASALAILLALAPRIIGMANDAVTYGRARKRRRRLEKARKFAEAERQKAALSQAAMALPSTSASARYNELLSPTSSYGASPGSAQRRGGNGFAFSISEASSSHVWASFGSVSQGQRPEVK